MRLTSNYFELVNVSCHNIGTLLIRYKYSVSRWRSLFLASRQSLLNGLIFLIQYTIIKTLLNIQYLYLLSRYSEWSFLFNKTFMWTFDLYTLMSWSEFCWFSLSLKAMEGGCKGLVLGLGERRRRSEARKWGRPAVITLEKGGYPASYL